MSYAFEEADIESMTGEELGPLLHGLNETFREIKPRSVDMTLDDLRMSAKSPGSIKRLFLVIDESGDLVGFLETRYPDDGSNPDTLRIEVRVFPGFRRQGAGTAMLGHAARGARELGRSRLLTWHYSTVPAGPAFARAAGAIEKLRFHENVLRIDQLDTDLMSGWAARSPSGYSLDILEGMPPDRVLAGIANLFYILERDMPRSEGQEPREWTPELVGAMTEAYLPTTDSLVALATDDASGEAVGMSQLVRRKSDPSTWIVTTTMVDREHRGRSIGKWLKGAINLEALERWPGGVYQETGNAYTNETMRAINRAMGFEHELTETEVEVTVEAARSFAATKTGA